MKLIRKCDFANGTVYALETDDGYPIEVTDTFLPYYTKNAVGRKQNKLKDYKVGSRAERWMIGVSVMSGCPIKCKFCATGQLPKWRNLMAGEIVDQVRFVLQQNPSHEFSRAQEYKINYTRMGEPFLNIGEVKTAIEIVETIYPHTHHYVSTIGINGSDFTWIKDNISLQVSLHSCKEARRDELIPFQNKYTIEMLGKIRTKSNLKTTLNLTLVGTEDFDIDVLKKHFPPDLFFIKLSPINPNACSEANELGTGIIEDINLV